MSEARPNRSWLRISLRTLLALTFVIAGVLSCAVSIVREVARERESHAFFCGGLSLGPGQEEAGSSTMPPDYRESTRYHYYVVAGYPPLHIKLLNRFFEQECAYVVEATLSGPGIDASVLNQLSAFCYLRKLELVNTRLTESNVQQLRDALPDAEIHFSPAHERANL